jgi:hypothetical protein
VNKSGIQGSRIVPTRISEYQVNRARKEDHDWVIRRMQHLSSAFDTRIDENGKVVLRPELPQTIKDR